MPELPEVETVRRRLDAALRGKQWLDVQVLHTDVIRSREDPEVFCQRLAGRTVQGVARRGKYLVIDLDGERLLCHLRMTGRLMLAGADEALAPHTHLRVALADGRELRFQDTRRFGGFYLIGAKGEGAPAGYRALGPEPLAADFTADMLGKQLEGRRTYLKAALLDQATVAGLGNIYVDEALFRAGLSPTRTSGTLSDTELRRLHRAIRAVLREAIEQRGTTFSDYLDSDGAPGSYGQSLRVFRRQGEACPRCGRPLVKSRVAGRGTHYCPHCQEG